MGPQKLTLKEGDEPALVVSVRDTTDDGTLVAADLNGCTAKWISKPTRKHLDSEGIELIANVTGNPLNGVVTVQIDSAVTSVAGSYWYKLLIFDEQGHQSTARYGPLIVAST
jgi:hypothetical protein